jgi:hypothetical protein
MLWFILWVLLAVAERAARNGEKVMKNKYGIRILIGLIMVSFGVIVFNGGCDRLRRITGDVNHYEISLDKVEQVRELLEIHPCSDDERAYVVGGELRDDGSLDLAVSCRKPMMK